jgi:hypothetical protein
MTKEKSEEIIEIAAYDMGRFPDTQEESDELGLDIVQKQMTALNNAIGGAFMTVFGQPITDVKLDQIMRVSKVGDGIGKETLIYQGTPFLELGEMEEEFAERDGRRHMIINQKIKVLS